MAAEKTPEYETFPLPTPTGVAIIAHFESLQSARRPGAVKMQLSYTSRGYVDNRQGEPKKDGTQRIWVTVYGALCRKVRDMLKTGELKVNDRLVVVLAIVNGIGYLGKNGPDAVVWAPVSSILFANGEEFIDDGKALAEVAPK